MVATLSPSIEETEQADTSADSDDTYEPPSVDVATQSAKDDFARFAAFLENEVRADRPLPTDREDLYKRWSQVRRDEQTPIDPFDGHPYGYSRQGPSYLIWSSGPDQEADTIDDLVFQSGTQAVEVRRPQSAREGER